MGSKWVKMDQNGLKWVKIGQIGSKWGQNGSTWVKMCGQNRVKMESKWSQSG